MTAMAGCECMGPIRVAMKLRRDMCGVAAEALDRMFAEDLDELIEQVCLISYRTSILEPDPRPASISKLCKF